MCPTAARFTMLGRISLISGARDVGPVVEYLCVVRETQGSIPKHSISHMVAQTVIPALGGRGRRQEAQKRT